MKFRPCIDIHNGKVKQIVGGSLKDEGNQAQENFVSEQDAAFYASLYKEKGLKGGHIILLNSADSEYFQATKAQAMLALGAYPGGLQIRDGHISWKNLEKMVDAAGKEHLVLDLSCRKKEDAYYVVTDRWQKFTEEEVTLELMEKLGAYCDEFLIHAVDVEGKAKGIEVSLAKLLGEYNGHPVTYAGGVGSMEDIQTLKMAAGGKLDVTVGSALDLFGGTIPFEKLIGNL